MHLRNADMQKKQATPNYRHKKATGKGGFFDNQTRYIA